MSPTFMGETTSFELVGEGEFPVELERVNLGGLWLAGLWALFNGFARWVFAVIAAGILIENLTLLAWQLVPFYQMPLEWFPAFLRMYGSVVAWSAAAVLGLYGDRLVWVQEQKRLARGGKPSRLPIPAWRYMRSQRRWGIAAVVIAALSYAGWVADIVRHVVSPASWLDLVLSVVVPVGVFVIDRKRRSIREANKRIERTP